MIIHCQRCDRPADRLVACGGDACTARVCGACLTVDGCCLDCAAEAERRIGRRCEDDEAATNWR